MKNFDPKAWFMPQAVIIIGTYDADETPNAMNWRSSDGKLTASMINGTLLSAKAIFETLDCHVWTLSIFLVPCIVIYVFLLFLMHSY